jgi:adenylate kinase
VETGQLFRNAVENETEIGEKARPYLEQGKYVPDEITVHMIEERLAEKDCRNGYILDGFPRQMKQAKIFGTDQIDTVLLITASEENIMTRLANRRVCTECGASYNTASKPPQKPGVCSECGGSVERRDDDTPALIQARLQEHRDKAKPVIEYYRDKDLVVEVEGNGSINAVWNRIKQKLGLKE